MTRVYWMRNISPELTPHSSVAAIAPNECDSAMNSAFAMAGIELGSMT